ncbi:TPM domain-containing protein [Fructilactobacillus myrtifloralis]|uniref:TPM domain-containing protein n=1 Tax=Fructilactobacillus myrtifloralis TaxID=2940301 RepID=A0ABY5BRF3_9LACO|nr:TPM domain-containing protein [Fructilactobacillus myrtifloralis]USS84813.1 TPM domain-containing protein [Fructilactobacillus myrtifloralis]
MKITRWLGLLLTLMVSLWGLGAVAHAAGQSSRFVQDEAGVLSPSTFQAVDNVNQYQLSHVKGKPQYAVITKNGLPRDTNIDDYAIDTARKLKIGRPGWHNGILLVVNVQPGHHVARLEVGTGLQGALPDGAVAQIFATPAVHNALRQQDYDRAVQTISTLVARRLREHQQEIDPPSQTQSRQTTRADHHVGHQNLLFVILLLLLVGLGSLVFSLKGHWHRSRKSYDQKVLAFLQHQQLPVKNEVLLNRMVDNLTAKQVKPTPAALWQAFNEENLKQQGIQHVEAFPELKQGPLSVPAYRQRLAEYEQKKATRTQTVKTAATNYLREQGYPDDPAVFLVNLLGTPAVQQYIATGTNYAAVTATIADQFRRHMVLNFMQTDPDTQRQLQREGFMGPYADYVNRLSRRRVERIYNGGNIRSVLLLSALAALLGSWGANADHHDHFDDGPGSFFGGDGGSGGFFDGGSFGDSFGGDTGGFDGGGGDSSGW